MDKLSFAPLDNKLLVDPTLDQHIKAKLTVAKVP